MLHYLSAARDANDSEAVVRITGQLRAAHLLLGHRLAGTREEQNTYLMARSTGIPLPELAAVGIDTNEWPAPPGSPAAVHSESESASAATERRIFDLFQSAGPLSEQRQPSARYKAEYRPQDDERYLGKLLPWAICDSVTGLPISYHEEKELAEYQADKASERFARASGEL